MMSEYNTRPNIDRETIRKRATVLALDFVRRYGFDSEFSANYTLGEIHEMDKAVTDVDVEKMLARLDAETRELLLAWKPLLLALSTELQVQGKLDGEVVSSLALAHGLEISVEPEGHLHAPAYAAQLEQASSGGA